MNEERRKLIDETATSLRRMQEFQPESISRRAELGTLDFAQGVPHVEKLVGLFREVSGDVLDQLSATMLNQVKAQADGQYNLLSQISTFTTEGQSPKRQRDQLLLQVEQGYDAVFDQLWPAIAYSVRRATDFARLEREARASIQAIADRTVEIERDLKARQEEAAEALEAIRKVAAEQGVSQQAIYFKEEAASHAQEAGTWLRRTVLLTVGLGVYAALTIVLHKIDWLTPVTTADAVQLAIGKVLVFATIAYFLVLSARNFMAHRHNAVVNKHRQNSLVTYTALVQAAGDQANRDIVLLRAADSIFGLQGSGFSQEREDSKPLSMVSVAPSLLRASETAS